MISKTNEKTASQGNKQLTPIPVEKLSFGQPSSIRFRISEPTVKQKNLLESQGSSGCLALAKRVPKAIGRERSLLPVVGFAPGGWPGAIYAIQIALERHVMGPRSGAGHKACRLGDRHGFPTLAGNKSFQDLGVRVFCNGANRPIEHTGLKARPAKQSKILSLIQV